MFLMGSKRLGLLEVGTSLQRRFALAFGRLVLVCAVVLRACRCSRTAISLAFK